MNPLAIPQRWFRNWALRRSVTRGTLVLNQRRIYIIPTRRGLAFALLLLLMLLGDINYNLSLGYLLTFLLATAGGLSMLHAFRNLAQLEIRAGHVEPVFAGEPVRFVFHFDNPAALARHALHLHDDSGHATLFDLPAQRATTITLALPTTRRGWRESGRLTLHTEFPLGLFHAWAYLHFDLRALVYPKPAAGSAPLPAAVAVNGTGQVEARGDEDFSGLRNYVTGDGLPRIAWKALAREQGLQVKQFTSPQGNELWLDWAQLPRLAPEQRLEQLTRWVLEAEAQGFHYGLRLPDGEIAPQQGAQHRAACLHRLALYGLPA